MELNQVYAEVDALVTEFPTLHLDLERGTLNQRLYFLEEKSILALSRYADRALSRLVRQQHALHSLNDCLTFLFAHVDGALGCCARAQLIFSQGQTARRLRHAEGREVIERVSARMASFVALKLG